MTPSMRSPWGGVSRAPPRSIVLKRLAIVCAVGLLVYLFINNLPVGIPIRDRRHPFYRPDPHPTGQPGGPSESGPRPMVPPQLDAGQKPTQEQSGSHWLDEDSSLGLYNGPLVFPQLLTSLQAIQTTGGSSSANKNVLFAAASLKSAALLLPMACRMGSELRNYVHFALAGGSEIDISELRALNGIDDSCQIIFHDARPDYPGASGTDRLRQSTIRALFHIGTYMHPQVAIIDASGAEEDYFLAGIGRQAPISGIPLIELPENAHSRLAWMSKLDSPSLAAWDKISVEILIQAPSRGSANLVRLLRSLAAVDFGAGSVPHLTIELPHNADRGTIDFLRGFPWPPNRALLPSHPRMLSLRHRIPSRRVSELESSARFLESFWPRNPKYSHVLVLSAHTQVSPQFWNYLKYSVLQYMYSGISKAQEWDSRLLGIGLNLPATYLDGITPFEPPSSNEGGSFLWQAPDSNAVLFTGQKWTELHAFVSRMITYMNQHEIENGDNDEDPVPLPFFLDKLVGKRYPAWLEHALQLCQARGYWTLYPGDATARNLATVHTELFHPPEEYAPVKTGSAPFDDEVPLTGKTLFETLPESGRLLTFDEMPLLLWDGRPTGLTGLDDAASIYTYDFRTAVGGCELLEEEEGELLAKKSMSDLFCIREEQ
ncbi:uncharacterized protein C8A04DRAFT_9513 [Dichotomopilus funicola]|uniref:Glycosyltransferase 2 n=1 Tax=Dichotomopilus funicola TaxID=1934379 RepID=A0AAN6V8I2_9PEZI|nr:hypothetical protein C8A04DRAFT_9513 [Dichotomopilus funicola]